MENPNTQVQSPVTDQIETLKELARELGIEIVIADPNAKSKQRPMHSNSGKTYRTRAKILEELTSARSELRQSKQDLAQLVTISRESRKKAKEKRSQIIDLMAKISDLTKEARSRKIKIGSSK